MIRDKRKDEVYFDNYINENLARITKYNRWLQEKKDDKTRELRLKQGKIDIEIDILIARYSNGESMKQYKQQFMDIVSDYIDLGKQGVTHSYTENIRFVSLAVLFSVPNCQFEELSHLKLHQDALMNFLLKSYMTKEIASEKLQISDYQKLYDVLFELDSTAQQMNLKEFVNNIWYKTNDETGWYESHKNTQVNIYNGYWCFVGGAVAKLVGIADDDLKDSPYYPYDLVHTGE